MKQTNKYGLKVGDIITFTNKIDYFVTLEVTRIEEKSCYTNGRNSWNTINGFLEQPDSKLNGQKPIIS